MNNKQVARNSEKWASKQERKLLLFLPHMAAPAKMKGGLSNDEPMSSLQQQVQPKSSSQLLSWSSSYRFAHPNNVPSVSSAISIPPILHTPNPSMYPNSIWSTWISMSDGSVPVPYGFQDGLGYILYTWLTHSIIGFSKGSPTTGLGQRRAGKITWFGLPDSWQTQELWQCFDTFDLCPQQNICDGLSNTSYWPWIVLSYGQQMGAIMLICDWMLSVIPSNTSATGITLPPAKSFPRIKSTGLMGKTGHTATLKPPSKDCTKKHGAMHLAHEQNFSRSCLLSLAPVAPCKRLRKIKRGNKYDWIIIHMK